MEVIFLKESTTSTPTNRRRFAKSPRAGSLKSLRSVLSKEAISSTVDTSNQSSDVSDTKSKNDVSSSTSFDADNSIGFPMYKYLWNNENFPIGGTIEQCLDDDDMYKVRAIYRDPHFSESSNAVTVNIPKKYCTVIPTTGTKVRFQSNDNGDYFTFDNGFFASANYFPDGGIVIDTRTNLKQAVVSVQGHDEPFEIPWEFLEVITYNYIFTKHVHALRFF